MSISQPPFQSTLVDADDRVQTPWAQWFSQLQPILQSVVASGPTSGRPTQNLYIGYPYFDTTIDQMVYWNGVIWVTYAPSTTGTSILKGNGSGGFNNAVAGVDFAPATSGIAILYGNGAGGFSSVSIGSGVTFAGGVLSATGSGGTVTAVTGTAPIASSGGTTPAISISQAGASTNGYLSSTDWNTFNNKGSGTVTAVTGSGNIASSGGNTPNITFTGTLPIANGGTNGTAAPSSGAVAYGTGTAYDFTSVGSTGQYLQSNGTSAPTWSSISSGFGSPAYYGLMISTTNQANGGSTTANIVALDASPVLSNGVSIVATGKITFSNVGKYHLITELSFINTVGSNPSTSVWITQNGSIIPNSAQDVVFQGGAGDVETSTCAWILDIAANDYVQVYWFCSATTVSLAYQGASTSPTRPASPSAIVSVFSLSQIGIGYYGLSSTTSNTIGTGNKTFTTNLSNLNTAFVVGTRIRVAYVTTPANFMEGVITSFSGTTLVVNVDSIGGSGTYANWTISVAGIQGSNGVTSITGTANQVIASTSTGAVTLSLPQSINSGATPTFVGTNFTGIPNTGLTNSSITFGTTAQALGSTVSTLNAVSIGNTTKSTGAFTSLTANQPVTFTGGTFDCLTLQASSSNSIGLRLQNTFTGSRNWNIGVSGGSIGTNGNFAIYDDTAGATRLQIDSTGAVIANQFSGSGSTLTNIPNSALNNSSVTINGASISLGGSATVTATATNALSIGTGLSGTSYNGSTAITIANSGVLSFSGSSTGLTPATATSGAVTLAGILVGANGGTGVANTGKTFTIGGNFTTSGAFTTTLTVTANTSLTLPVSGTVLSSVTAPTANPITGTPSATNFLRGDGTWATPAVGGTVTSVAATVPAFLSISGSPITTSGTLAFTLSGTALPVANGGTGLTTGGPAVCAYLSGAAQSVTSNVITKITLNTKYFDTNSNFDAVTNYRFTPTIAGYYKVSFSVHGTATGTSVQAVNAIPYKNGGAILSTYGLGSSIYPTAVSESVSVGSILVYMNGSTDYFELYGKILGTLPSILFAQMSAFLARGA